MSVRNLGAVAQAIAWVLGRHLGVVSMIFGIPAALVAVRLGRALKHRGDGPPVGLEVPVALLALLVPGMLILMTTKLTVEVMGGGRWETLDRLHGRYYSFSLPLLVLAGAALRPMAERSGWNLRRTLAIAVAAIVAFGAFCIARIGDPPYVVDYPDAFALLAPRWMLFVALAVALGAAAVALTRPAWVWRMFLGWFALFSLAGAASVFQGLRDRATPSDADRVGIVLRGMLTDPARDSVAVFSRQIDFRSHYLGVELLSLARFRVAEDLSGAGCAEIAAGVRYLVTLDPIPVGCGFSPLLKIGDAQVFERLAR
jgi:hypothetical protein